MKFNFQNQNNHQIVSWVHDNEKTSSKLKYYKYNMTHEFIYPH